MIELKREINRLRVEAGKQSPLRRRAGDCP